MALSVFAPNIKFDGKPLSRAFQDSLVDCRLLADLYGPAKAALRFHDPHFDLFDANTVKIGAKLVVELPNQGGRFVEVFEGRVDTVLSENSGNGRHQFVVEALDESALLNRELAAQSFQNMKVSEVAGKICRGYGLSLKFSGADVKLPYYLAVGRGTDILNHLAQLVGAEWWCEGKQICFGSRIASGSKKLTWGEDLTSLSVRYSAGSSSTGVTVTGWDSASQKTFSASTDRKGVSGKDVGVDAPVSVDRTRETTRAGYKADRLHHLSPQSPTEAKALAASELEALASNEVLLVGEALPAPELRVGSELVVDGVGKRASGKYRLSRVEHWFGAGRATITRFEAGPRYIAGIAGQIAKLQSRSMSDIHRLTVGIVTNINDPEKEARVRVKMPLYSEDDEGQWARVLALGAGPGRGLQISPEVGDEVLVAFSDGDLRAPVVLGSVWSKKNKPPVSEVSGGKAAKNVWSARSGGVIEFVEDDDLKKTVIKVQHADKKTTVVLEEKKISVRAADGGSIEFSVGQASIALQSDGTIDIKGAKLALKGSQSITVNGQKVTIKGALGTVADGGGSKLDLGPAGAKLASNAITEIKGAMVKVN